MARTHNNTDYHSIGSNICQAAAWSVNCWFKAADITNFGMIWAASSGSTFFQVTCAGNVTGDPIRFQANQSGGANADTSSGFSAGTWHMATVVHASTTDRRVFLDGGNKGTSTTSKAPIPTTIGIGIRQSTTSNQAVDQGETAFWDTALTDAEVASLYGGGIALSPFNVQPDSLQHYWRGLEPAAGSDLQDIVGGLSMTQTSSPAVADHVPVIYPRPHQVILPSSGAPPAASVGRGLTTSLKLDRLELVG